MILIQVDQFNLLIFNPQKFNLIHEDSIQFDQILIRWKVQIFWAPTLFKFDGLPKLLISRIKALNVNSLQKLNLFFRWQGAIIVKDLNYSGQRITR
jgi:hypothetical protein